jgi:hypothetical protein
MGGVEEANVSARVSIVDVIIIINNKGKALPLQAWTDSEGSRRLRLPDFKTVGT